MTYDGGRMRSPAAPARLTERDRLPLALRAYEFVGSAAAPLAPRLAGASPRPRQRRRRAARRALRRSDAAASGRSVDLDPRRQRRRNAGGHSADRAHSRPGFRGARHLRHGDVGGARRTAPAQGRAAPIHPARRAALRRPLSRSLAAGSRFVRRVRSVAQSDRGECAPQHPDDSGQRPRVAALVRPLAVVAGRHRIAAAPFRSVPGAVERRRRPLRAARRAARELCRQSQARRAGAAGRPGGVRQAQSHDRLARRARRRIDPPRRRNDDHRRAPAAARANFRRC